MDCYYHNAVPSVAVCNDCSQTICATCRDEHGLCPGCRLARRIDAASAARSGLTGGVGPSNPPPGAAYRQAPPPPEPPPYVSYAPAARPAGPLATVSQETRGLLALGYPLWPLAALALLDPKRSPAVRRQAIQALALNFGLFAVGSALSVIAHIWVLGIPAMVLFPFLFPVWLIATIVYGFKVWHGDDVRVPLISDWLDERENRTTVTV
jgi:uncharacterized membrane protein